MLCSTTMKPLKWTAGFVFKASEQTLRGTANFIHNDKKSCEALANGSLDVHSDLSNITEASLSTAQAHFKGTTDHLDQVTATEVQEKEPLEQSKKQPMRPEHIKFKDIPARNIELKEEAKAKKKAANRAAKK